MKRFEHFCGGLILYNSVFNNVLRDKNAEPGCEGYHCPLGLGCMCSTDANGYDFTYNSRKFTQEQTYIFP